jgi:hypothetical protein
VGAFLGRRAVLGRKQLAQIIATQPPADFQPQGDPRQVEPPRIHDALCHALGFGLDGRALLRVRDFGELVADVGAIGTATFLGLDLRARGDAGVGTMQ